MRVLDNALRSSSFRFWSRGTPTPHFYVFLLALVLSVNKKKILTSPVSSNDKYEGETPFHSFILCRSGIILGVVLPVNLRSNEVIPGLGQ
jgi:hypothetical protein